MVGRAVSPVVLPAPGAALHLDEAKCWIDHTQVTGVRRDHCVLCLPGMQRDVHVHDVRMTTPSTQQADSPGSQLVQLRDGCRWIGQQPRHPCLPWPASPGLRHHTRRYRDRQVGLACTAQQRTNPRIAPFEGKQATCIDGKPDDRSAHSRPNALSAHA